MDEIVHRAANPLANPPETPRLETASRGKRPATAKRSCAKKGASGRMLQQSACCIGFDAAENEPCKVCPLSVYRSSRCGDASCGTSNTPTSTSRASCGISITGYQSQIYDRGWVLLACFGKLWIARSRLYRSQNLQVNTRWISLESSRRDLHSALLRTVLESNPTVL